MSPERRQPPDSDIEQPQDIRAEQNSQVENAYNELARRLLQAENLEFGEPEQAILKLKLTRYFQREEDIDLNTLFDAIIETPNFIKIEKGGLHRLLKTHEQKTLQKIAEIRKERALMTGNEKFNPYENLFTTTSGKFYLARLLNMPHLQEESEYMNNCVGTSDSYVNKMKRGEVEIFSLRTVPVFNEETGKLEGDKPVLTIEYDVKNKKIIQMKKINDALIETRDIADLDIFDLLKQTGATLDDADKVRDFTRIAPDELVNISVSDYHVLTQNGETHYRDFNPESGGFVLKAGSMPLEGLPKVEVAKIVNILSGLKVEPEEIAQTESEMTGNIKIYLGPLYKNFFKTLPDSVDHIYTKLPEGRIRQESVEIDKNKTSAQYLVELEKQGHQIYGYAKHMLERMDKQNDEEKRKNILDRIKGVFNSEESKQTTEQVDMVRLTIADLGFPSGATKEQVYAQAEKLGLELCPAEVGPQYRLQYTNQPMGEWVYVGMEPILDPGGHPDVFSVGRGGGGSWLSGDWAEPGHHWGSDSRVLFRLRK